MKQLRPLLICTIILLAIVLGLVILLPNLNGKKRFSDADQKGGVDMVILNYGHTIDSAAELYGISSSYLKALCMLECSGRKMFVQRFEPHVYKRLKKVKFGELSNYEHVTKDMLEDANDEALKNLASSWGPFQLMGYKCLLLGIKVRDIRGDDAVVYGAKWIQMTYGEYLKAKQFKHAFHIHNTGKPFPINGRSLTYDKDYISRGLKYMEYFDTH